jgi:CHAD domain-containing protein
MISPGTPQKTLTCKQSVPYYLKSGERVPAGIRRIIREEIVSAARELSGAGSTNRDEAIHEARKSMKKIRGAMRLMRPELDAIYPPENAWFRDVGRRLSQFRDARVMIETFDALRKKYRASLGATALASVRRGLAARRKPPAELESVLRPLAAELRRSSQRVRNWPLLADGFAALAPGLETAFRKGRKAFHRVCTTPSHENYHEWRKRVKDHWYHVRLFERYWTAPIEAYEKSLKELETLLGEDHNLVVLERTLRDAPASRGNATDVDLLFKLITRDRKELRGKARKLGRHIYTAKPRRLTKQFHQLWDVAYK